MLDVVDHAGVPGQDKGAVRELRLARPPANALGPALLGALNEALHRAPAEGAAAIVLSGAPGRFSGGMDVPAMLAMKRDELAATWGAFFEVLRTLARSPVPVVAALTGHSPAGGTVLALFADYRVLADGPFLVGLNEVQVGLPVPAVLLEVLVQVVGRRQAARLATTGALVGPQEALRVGLVDEVVAVEQVVPRALAWAGELVSRPRRAMLATRAQARAPLAGAAEDMNQVLVDDVVEAWYGEECQRTMRALAERLAASSRRA